MGKTIQDRFLMNFKQHLIFTEFCLNVGQRKVKQKLCLLEMVLIVKKMLYFPNSVYFKFKNFKKLKFFSWLGV